MHHKPPQCMQKPKQANTAPAPQETSLAPENAKIDNTNLLAFNRAGGITLYLKECTNCKKKYTTENREARTCNDHCAHDNKTRGSERYLWQANPTEIASNFDIENYLRRNEKHTPHQLKREAQKQAKQEAEAQRQKEIEQARKARAEQFAKTQKAEQKKLQKFLSSLPQDIESCLAEINKRNQKIVNDNQTIFIEIDNILFLIFDNENIKEPFAVLPTKMHQDIFISEIKKSLNTNHEPDTLKILEDFCYSFNCGDTIMQINGLLQVCFLDIDTQEADQNETVESFLIRNNAHILIDF